MEKLGKMFYDDEQIYIHIFETHGIKVLSDFEKKFFPLSNLQPLCWQLIGCKICFLLNCFFASPKKSLKNWILGLRKNPKSNSLDSRGITQYCMSFQVLSLLYHSSKRIDLWTMKFCSM